MIGRPAVAAIALFWALGCARTAATSKVPILPPSDPKAVSKMAQGVEAAKDSSGRTRAIELMQSAVQADDKLWEARYDLGVLRAQAGDLAAAERDLALAQKLAPNAEDVAVALSEVRRRRDDADGAVEALEGFVKQHPQATVAPVALMGALREANRVDDAIKLAHQVLVRRSRDPYALSELALAHLDRDEIDTAEILSQEALKADQKSAVAERTAGLIALRKGDDADAFRHFARSAELDPEDTTSCLNIGTVLLEAGVYDRAAEHFQAVHEQNPDDVAAALGLSAARRGQAKKGDTQALGEAESLLKQVLEKQPSNLAATHNLAVLYAYTLDRPAQARPLFQRFLQDSPKSHPARAEAETWLASHQK